MNQRGIIVFFICILLISNLLYSGVSRSTLQMLPKDKDRLNNHLELLKSKDSGERERAAIAIFHFAYSADQRYPFPKYRDMPEFASVVEPLIHALDDPIYRVRANAARALGRVNDERAFNALVLKLTDEHAEVRKGILRALSEGQDERANSYLIDRLLDLHPEVRLAAAYELGRKKTRSAIVPLIMVLESEEKSSVRQTARNALMEITNGLDFGDSHSEWQAWLLQSLQKRDGRIRSIPENSHPIEQLLRNAVNNEDPIVRQKAQEELIASGDQAFEYLFKGLKDEDWRIRRMAAKILGFAQNSLAIDPLVTAAKEENEDVRETAKSSLEMLRLNTRLSGDRKLLGEQDFSNLESLKQAVQHNDAMVRRKAAVELGKISEAEAVNVLIIPLLDENANVRIAARDALRQRKETTKVVDALTAVLQYDSVQQKIPLLTEIIGILKDKDDPASIHVLADFLKHEDMSVRQHTIVALDAIGTTDALVLLIESLHDEVEFVRRTAAAVLSKSNDPNLIEPLIDALSDPDPFTRDSAMAALVNITKQDFRLDILRWHEWWNENREKFVE